jgi:transposase
MSHARPSEAPVLNAAQREAFLARVRPGVSPEDYRVIEAMTYALPQIVESISQERMTMRKLRHLLFGAKTEQTDRVCPPAASPPSLIPPVPKPRRRGHGRIKATDYTGARWMHVAHPDLQPGQRCPLCAKGIVRQQSRPAIVLRIEGSPPIAADAYTLERLRCDACGAVFTAPAPAAAGQEKYAPSVGVTIAVLRYGTGLPHYRLERLQQSLGVPLPASTQWELLAPLREQAQPIFDALVVQAANAPLLHHDDTTMRILDLRRPGSATVALMNPGRKGTFTTNVLAEVESHPIALFFTGWQHAGENLAAVLQQRTADLAPPIQMCDALSRNLCPESNTILALCLSHGRREFVSVAASFPEECRYVLESLREVYRYDAEAKELGLKPESRLIYHQTHSQPVMERLQAWMREKLDGKHVEPNSGLGEAIRYMLKHWEPLTLFLRQAGAPLDNNACEAASCGDFWRTNPEVHSR